MWDGPVRFPVSHQSPISSRTAVPRIGGCETEHEKAGGLAMHAIDSAILTHCVDESRRLKPLFKTIPKATLYRHRDRLMQRGWLLREGLQYRTTEAGRRHLKAAHQGRQWNQF